MAFLSVKVEESSNYQPCPEGFYQAVCWGVENYGEITEEFEGEKKINHKIAFVFQVEEKMEDGRPYQIRHKMNITFSDRGKFRPFIEKWVGKKLVVGQVIKFENFVGMNCGLMISHNEGSNGKTYANIDAISKHNPQKPKLEPVGTFSPHPDAIDYYGHVDENEPPQEKQEPQPKTVKPDVEFDTPPDTEDAPF